VIEAVPAPSPAEHRPARAPLTDGWGREIKSLRVSVTDRCNFRCRYSAPLTTAAPARSPATVVNVTGKEFRFILSRKSGPHGTFIFQFKNAGTVVPIRLHGPGHAAAGMKGVFTVT
jgi:hypothetical protein